MAKWSQNSNGNRNEQETDNESDYSKNINYDSNKKKLSPPEDFINSFVDFK